MEAFTVPRVAVTSVRQCNSALIGRAFLSRPQTCQNQRGALQVVCGKGKGKKGRRMGNPRQNQQLRPGTPPTPPVDPNDEEFVLFVRSKKVPMWYPYSIMKGGWAANALVKGQESNLVKDMSSGALVKNVSEALYAEYDAAVKSVRDNYPPLKRATELEFGFKIRDKTKPDDWYKAVDVQPLLPREEVGKSVVDNVVSGVQGMFGKGK